ncbi:MAG: cytochrome b [Pseudomonadota bacterium]
MTGISATFWSAALILSAIMTSAFLNAYSSAFRAVGTAIAATTLLGMVAWFAWVLQTGILQDPEPPRLPTDEFKPVILWTLSTAAFAAGCFLLWVFSRQLRRTDRLAIELSNNGDQFGLISRHLHWISAILILAAIPIGIFSTLIPRELEWRDTYYAVHKTVGIVILALAIARVLWHRMSLPPPPSQKLSAKNRAWAKRAHSALYFLIFAFPISGYLMSSFAGNSSQFFGLELTSLVAPNDFGRTIFGAVHKLLLPAVFLIVIAAHILGALKHHFIDKHHAAISRIVS